MWVFLPGGFISVVAHREQPNDFMIRSRNSEHLSILFPECEIIELDDSDYRYRTVLPRREVNDMISKHIENMEYDNFKSRCPPTYATTRRHYDDMKNQFKEIEREN